MLALLVLCLVVIGCSATSRTQCTPKKLDPEDPTNYCSFQFIEKKLTKGSWCLARPERVYPTQVYVGKVEMDCFKSELESLSSSDLVDSLMSNNLPVVVGPKGNLYLTDHHHFALALYESFLDFKRPMIHKVLYVCVQEDFSSMTKPRFWSTMEKNGLALLRDEFGNNINATDLPKSLKDLRDNPYRTLAAWVRRSNGYVKCGAKHTKDLPQCQNQSAPFFLECEWAEFLLAKFPLTNYPEEPVIPPPIDNFIWKANFQSQTAALVSVLKQAVAYATSPAAKNMPGFNLSPDKLPPSVADISKHGCLK